MNTKLTFLSLIFFLALGSFAFSQVKGTIKDSDGFPVDGAEVSVVGKDITTYTDIDGNFNIDAAVGDKLTVTTTGGSVTDFPVFKNNMGSLTVSNYLTEVVKGAYGISESSRQASSSYQVVEGNTLNKPSALSVDLLLQGNARGVDVTAGSGQPGANSTVMIRGINSLTGSTTPLYIIDGTPVLSGDVSGLSTTSNALSSINPSDIEKVEVLKDADATAIYGSRASNGVIMITTKSGKGKGKFYANTEMGLSGIAYENLRFNQAENFVGLTAIGMVNYGAFPNYTTAFNYAKNTFFKWDGKSSYNWKKATRRNSPIYARYTASYSGGNDKMGIYASIAYLDQEGITRDSKFNRLSSRLNIDYKASNKLNLKFGVNLAKTKNVGPADGSSFRSPIFTSFIMSPTNPIYNADGTYNLNLVYLNPTFNVVGIQNTDKNFGDIYKALVNFDANLEITKHISFTSNFGTDFNYYDELIYWNPNFGDGINAGDPNGDGNGYKTDRNFNTYNFYNFFHYNNSFKKKHNLNVDLGMEYTQQTNKYAEADAQGYPYGRYDLYQLANAANPTYAYSNKTERTLVGYVARLAYNYDGKAGFNASFRRDGSSTFGPNKKYGDFFAIGTFLNFNTIFSMGPKVNQLKLRASYGETGNRVGYYDYIPQFSLSGSYQNLSSGYISAPGNYDLQWESAKKMNFGLDWGFFNNRLNGTFDYFQSKNADQLLQAPSAPSAGFSTILQNVGDIKVTGFEAGLSGMIINKKDFTWEVNVNFSNIKNEVTKLTSTSNEAAIGGSKRLVVGHDPSEYYLRLWAGVDDANGDPLWYTSTDRTTTTNTVANAPNLLTGKKAFPTNIASFGTTFNFKGISINALFNYKGDFSVYDRWAFVYDNEGNYPNLNHLINDTKFWTAPGQGATRPKYIYNGNKSSNSGSTRYLYDGDYIRFRSLEVGYRFTKDFMNLDFLNGIYVYFRGTNIATFMLDKKTYFDPESTSNAFNTQLEGLGIYDMTQPNLKQFIFGITLDF